jgi:hypothetical protein
LAAERYPPVLSILANQTWKVIVRRLRTPGLDGDGTAVYDGGETLPKPRPRHDHDAGSALMHDPTIFDDHDVDGTRDTAAERGSR